MRAGIDEVRRLAFPAQGQTHLAAEILRPEYEAHHARARRSDGMGVEEADRAFDGDEKAHGIPRHAPLFFRLHDDVLDRLDLIGVIHLGHH